MTMMSARHALPLLQPGQAQKELYHNEALVMLDLAVHAVVESVGRDDPPLTADLGQSWIIGTAPTGAWAGHGRCLVGMTAGGWRYVTPQHGMVAWSIADGCRACWDGAAWKLGEVVARSIHFGGVQVVGARQPTIPHPTAGAVVDIEGRAALSTVIDALAAHGLIHP